MAKEVQNRELETEAYDLLGQSYHYTGKFQESVQYGELSLRSAKAVRNAQLEKEERINLNQTIWYLDELDPTFLDDSEMEVLEYSMSGTDVSMWKTNFRMIYKWRAFDLFSWAETGAPGTGWKWTKRATIATEVKRYTKVAFTHI